MDKMRVKIGVKESVKKKLMKSTWAGHVERMGDEKLAKRADVQKVEGRCRRGRPKLRWGIVLIVLDWVGISYTSILIPSVLCDYVNQAAS